MNHEIEKYPGELRELRKAVKSPEQGGTTVDSEDATCGTVNKARANLRKALEASRTPGSDQIPVVQAIEVLIYSVAVPR